MTTISKQVIVMRKKFIINGKEVNVRKGKLIAQGCHASVNAITDLLEIKNADAFKVELNSVIQTDSALYNWLSDNKQTKICVYVETEEELREIHAKAKDKGLPCWLVTDLGLTEFNNVPTVTCCAIGPAWDFEVDEITGHLPLL